MKAEKTITRKYYKNYTQTFNASSSFQTFTVPATVTFLSVDCVASKGNNGGGSGGNGGRVQCVTQVTAGSTLYIMVGTIPSSQASAEYNASDIRTNNAGITDNTSLNSRILVAGGGGSGTSGKFNHNGGAGGGLTGGVGTAASSDGTGKGGTQTAGGAGGRNANSGSFGLGGAGNVGGAGGSGWYGGGAGSSTTFYVGGGGGGSSYTDPSCFNVIHTQGYNDGTGYITITYAIESTENDYDFYRDFYEVKVVKETINNEDKFYGVKEYKRGQYYGN